MYDIILMYESMVLTNGNIPVFKEIVDTPSGNDCYIPIERDHRNTEFSHETGDVQRSKTWN